MRNRLLLFGILLLIATNITAQKTKKIAPSKSNKITTTHTTQDNAQKYQVRINWKGHDSGEVYLCVNNFNGLQLLDTFKTSKISMISTLELDTKKILKGIYVVVLSNPTDKNKDVFINLIINKDPDINIIVDSSAKVTVINSEENKIFYEYIKESSFLYAKAVFFKKQLNNASITDKQKFIDTLTLLQKENESLTKMYETKYPNHLLHTVLTIQNVEKFLTISQKSAYEKKKYFFEYMPWQDEALTRVINFYDVVSNYVAYKTDYMDSVIKNVLTMSKLMSKKNYIDFVNEVANLFCLKKATVQHYDETCITINDSLIEPKKEWFTNKVVSLIGKKSLNYKMSKIGKGAPNLEALDTLGNKISLQTIPQADYTVLAFWDPHCSHCKQQIPIIDSLLNTPAMLQKNIIAVGIKIDGPKEDWLNFIHNKKLFNRWVHAEDTKALREEQYKQGKISFRISYDIDQTPLFFVLDKNKKIIAKYFSYKDLTSFIK